MYMYVYERGCGQQCPTVGPRLRVFYIKLHNILLDIGVKRFVDISKWTAFAVSLVLTVGHVVEYMVFMESPSTMVYYNFFVNQRTQLEEFGAIFDQGPFCEHNKKISAQLLLCFCWSFSELLCAFSKYSFGTLRKYKKKM